MHINLGNLSLKPQYNQKDTRVVVGGESERFKYLLHTGYLSIRLLQSSLQNIITKEKHRPLVVRTVVYRTKTCNLNE